MATTYTKELIEVITLPSANNAIKKVSLELNIYDDVVGAGTFITYPVQAILSQNDLTLENYITTANNALTKTDIIDWAWEYVGGDTYYNEKIGPAADAMLSDQLQFAGTVAADLDNIPD